jgi:hypothetical protein
MPFAYAFVKDLHHPSITQTTQATQTTQTNKQGDRQPTKRTNEQTTLQN